jgi:hypothetical protein
LAGWPTTRKTDGDKGVRSSEGAIKEFERKGTGADLPTVATTAGWPTPTSLSFAESHRPGNNRSMNRTLELVGVDTPFSNAQMESRGVLNAAHSRWLMGFPRRHDQLSPGWSSWVTLQQMLAAWCATPSETGPAA